MENYANQTQTLVPYAVFDGTATVRVSDLLWLAEMAEQRQGQDSSYYAQQNRSALQRMIAELKEVEPR